MAAAAPVLERRTDTSEYTDDVQHNARIRDNYARLINPNTRLSELMGREEEVQDTAPVQSYDQREYYRANPYEALFGKPAEINQAAPAAPAHAQPRVELVTNARADSDLFRADSPINRRLAEPAPAAAPEMDVEEENEDLRPTRTTTQYGTAERLNDEAPSSTVKDEEHVTIGKRERIIIGAFVSMVVALFVLVIINSAIISGINRDINAAQSALDDVQTQYAELHESVEEAKSADSVYAFAAENGMLFVGTED